MKLYSFLILLIMLLVSCGQEIEEKSVGATRYPTNQAEKEPFILRSPDGDTIPTGVPIPAKGKWINPDSVAKPKTVSLQGTPKVEPVHTNIQSLGKPKVVAIPEKLTIITPGKNGIPQPVVYNHPKMGPYNH